MKPTRVIAIGSLFAFALVAGAAYFQGLHLRDSVVPTQEKMTPSVIEKQILRFTEERDLFDFCLGFGNRFKPICIDSTATHRTFRIVIRQMDGSDRKIIKRFEKPEQTKGD